VLNFPAFDSACSAVIHYCIRCGASVSLRIPAGDSLPRHVCQACGHIHYENPRLVICCVAEWEGKILLCRRAIEPRKGFWTLPAGFLELHETPEEGAQREAWAEARAKIAIDALLAVYSVPRISQVQLIFRATLADLHFEAGPESTEVRLFVWNEIPWSDLAFPSVRWALDEYRARKHLDNFAAFTNPPGETGDF